MVDTFYRADSAGNIAMVSASVQELLGYTIEELIEQSLDGLCRSGRSSLAAFDRRA